MIEEVENTLLLLFRYLKKLNRCLRFFLIHFVSKFWHIQYSFSRKYLIFVCIILSFELPQWLGCKLMDDPLIVGLDSKFDITYNFDAGNMWKFLRFYCLRFWFSELMWQAMEKETYILLMKCVPKFDRSF